MKESAVFYQLTQKFIDEERALPEAARQVVYSTLAIGHHIGVMDCFHRLFEIPLEAYRTWVAGFPPGTARKKMEGLLRWGEIEITQSHAADLLKAFEASWTEMSSSKTAWAETLAQCLRSMMDEPALYLIVRRQT